MNLRIEKVKALIKYVNSLIKCDRFCVMTKNRSRKKESLSHNPKISFLRFKGMTFNKNQSSFFMMKGKYRIS